MLHFATIAIVDEDSGGKFTKDPMDLRCLGQVSGTFEVVTYNVLISFT